MATKKTDPIKVVTDITEEFVKNLGIEAKVSVVIIDDEEGPEYQVSLEGEDLGVLIGYHGETLNGLQLILSLVIGKKLGEWVRVTLDAGEWRQRRFETLRVMADKAAERAVAYKEVVELPEMSSSDRRLVHIALKGRTDITSESQGEEGFRRVVIRPA